MTRRKTAFTVAAAAALVLVAFLAAAATAATTAGPAWKVTLASTPTNLRAEQQPDFEEGPQYTVIATNVGGAPTHGTFTFTDTLPAGVSPITPDPHSASPFAQSFLTNFSYFEEPFPCEIDGQTVTCRGHGSVPPGKFVFLGIIVKIDNLPDPTVLTNSVTLSGGGAPTTGATTETTITPSLPKFGFVPGAAGISATLGESDSSAATQAGSHPYQLTVDLATPSRGVNDQVVVAADGGIRDSRTVLPAGLIVNPNATPVRCTELQLEGFDCPDASQVGNVTINTTAPTILPTQSPVFNMVPPAGEPAALGFDALLSGIYVHLIGGVREGDYRLTADASDILAKGLNPLLSFQLQLWGDPSGSNHNYSRGDCAGPGYSPDFSEGQDWECRIPAQSTPLLTMPTSCPADPLNLEMAIDSWGHPTPVVHDVPFTDSEGNPTGVTGCNALQFEPKLKARPTTTVADSPSGLEAELEIPQTSDHETLATAHLRKAEVKLPEGMAINPSSANGLGSCSSAQVGVDPSTGVANGALPTCPNASKIGRVEVKTPLLDHPLPGSVYVATPHDNPFDSLLAIYVVVDDRSTSTLVKLAGHVVADPQTGRLTTTFDKGPQLPFSSFKLDFFGGPAGVLRTPPTCGPYSTTSSMTPWSAPESGPPATPVDNYEINQGPGRPCASTVEAQPNAPFFDAGSTSLIAGAYTPFVVNLKRDDGTQQFSTVTLRPPPGLLGKLANTPYCPEAALAAAAAKSGSQEKANPSCPAASRIGTVNVGAGAGPAPYYTQGAAYLTGPYKGAPIGMAIVTPATAGPYDLGTVVVRVALRLDPEGARITADADPIPTILQGIPLDVRSAQIKLDRPDFTLNPTSCDPMAVTGSLLSSLGQVAPLESRFQVAECARLGFKPSLSLRLKGKTTRGSHPALRAVLTAKPGQANIAKTSVALPHSEFLDQAHIGTICTRVQFAAGQCPPASIYGHATATTPLLDYPISGPVYLRSSSNTLPDLVVALRGPDRQPIEVVVAGRIDSVRGGIRNSFEAVPDAPISRFVLEMPGGRKGLLVNSRNLCKATNKAKVEMEGQNGKVLTTRPVLKNDCKRGKHKKARHGHSR